MTIMVTEEIMDGDRVEILRRDIGGKVRPKNRRRFGRVLATDGSCYYVVPAGAKWTVELYQNEIRKVQKK